MCHFLVCFALAAGDEPEPGGGNNLPSTSTLNTNTNTLHYCTLFFILHTIFDCRDKTNFRKASTEKRRNKELAAT